MGMRNPDITKRRLDNRKNMNKKTKHDRRKIRSVTPKTEWRAWAQHATNQLHCTRHYV